ncbi:MAG TPA: hypothetical protein DCP96_05295, partial [Lachnospiraceae bacterium]|nr:hypothetical protein [Lachnospiraceae bacterium]
FHLFLFLFPVDTWGRIVLSQRMHLEQMIVLYDSLPDALVCFDSDYIAGVLSALHVHMSPYCDYHRSFLSKKQVKMLHYMKVSDSIQ